MANKRMFARSVINKWKFLKLPATARLLYYDLGMEADDDGFVEPYPVIYKTRGEIDDLFLLRDIGYITILDNEELTSHITDWTTNNSIRSDRRTPSIYLDKYGDILTTKVQPIDNQKTAENSIVENNIDYYSSSLGEEKGREGSTGREGKQPFTQTTPQKPYTATTDQEYEELRAKKLKYYDEGIGNG